MLALEKVSVSYGPIRAVRDVTFSIEEGDVVALLGPNGAGKTTLLSAVMGLVPVAAGSVTFGNEVITGGRVEDIVRHGITMVPEGRQIFATLTVEENLRLPILGRSRESEQSWGMDDVLGLFPVLRDRLRARAGTQRFQHLSAHCPSLGLRTPVQTMDFPRGGLPYPQANEPRSTVRRHRHPRLPDDR